MKNEYPKNDTDFEEATVTQVTGNRENGWQITRDDSWSFWIQKDSPVEPKAGMTARFFGRGVGSVVRGVYLDGQKVYYRTAEESKEYQEIQSYGKDGADWLDRWDSGRSVWSIEMGGLGPGYEQCIHVTCAEILRLLIAKSFNFDQPDDVLKAEWDALEKEMFDVPAVKDLGLSGAQFGAARSLAAMLYRKGPRELMKDEQLKDRHIQVSRFFPGMAKTAT